ncbi:MAG: hypothetical protein JW942_00965 [Opitutales bacterium]|nr:hypothetical protein [Opitutales bacterium]
MSTISSVSSNTAVAANSSSTTDKSTLNSQDFLKLLTVQLANQDPFEPMSDTEFISQMANFSSLEQMSELSSNFTSFSSRQEQLSSQAFLGREVSIDQGEESDVTGTVSAVTIDDNGSIFVTVDGVQYASSLVRSVSNPSTATE